MKANARRHDRGPWHTPYGQDTTSLLHGARLGAVEGALVASGAESVLDLGCGPGPLLIRLANNRRFRHIVGVDISRHSLRMVARRLSEDGSSGDPRVRLLHASFMDPHIDLSGFDAAVLMETIEHVEPDKLSSVEQAVFTRFRPKTVIITTPNRECNELLGVPRHRLRHRDHRFEWTRGKFRSWARGAAGRNRYDVTFQDVGWTHPAYGGPTQMAVFALGSGET